MRKRAPGVALALFMTLFCVGLWGMPAPTWVDLDQVSRGRHALKADLWYLEDATGRLTIDDVVKGKARLRFEAHPNRPPNFGNTTSTFWFRFGVRAGKVSQPWFLEIDFPPLDLVELYTSTQSGRYAVLRSGDAIAFHERPFEVPNHLFPLALEAGEAREFYVKVYSSGSVTAPMHLFSESTLRTNRDRQSLGAGLFFGALLSLGLYNLLLFVAVRDRSYFYYSIATVLFALVYLSTFGYGFQYLWPDSPIWNNYSPASLALWALAATVPFTRTFLDTRRAAPILDRLLIASAVISAVTGFLNLGIMPYHITFKVLSLLLTLHVPLLLGTSIVCMRRGVPLAKFFLLAWLPMIIAALTYVMRAMTWLPPNFLTIYGFQVGSALEMILLSFALAYRITQARREKEMAQEALLRTLKESERELEEAVIRRTAELNTVNRELESEVKVRRHAEERLLHMAHHDPLTGLPNRALLKERFGQFQQQARRHRMMMGMLLLDLDGFKRVNDTLGHDAGDDLLVGVGQLLGHVVRGTDTVARLGGDEFVVLMTEMSDEGAAGEVAEKILAALHTPVVTRQNRLLQAGASIGIALYPTDGTDLDTLLRRADTAMYQAKGAGRGCYRYFSAPVASKEVLLRATRRPDGSPHTSEP